jgi:hypothetical protein
MLIEKMSPYTVSRICITNMYHSRGIIKVKFKQKGEENHDLLNIWQPLSQITFKHEQLYFLNFCTVFNEKAFNYRPNI